MLVGNEVVGIVRADAVVTVLPDKFTCDELAGDGTILAIGPFPGSSEDLIEVFFLHGTSFAHQIFKLCFGAQFDLIPREIDDVVLGNAIAHSVEELGTDDLGRGGHFGIGRRIEFQLIGSSGRIGDAKPRGDASDLILDDLPLCILLRSSGVRASRKILERHRRFAVAIGEPAGVRNLADGVDISGPSL